MFSVVVEEDTRTTRFMLTVLAAASSKFWIARITHGITASGSFEKLTSLA
jgi:hypothetical protein